MLRKFPQDAVNETKWLQRKYNTISLKNELIFVDVLNLI